MINNVIIAKNEDYIPKLFIDEEEQDDFYVLYPDKESLENLLLDIIDRATSNTFKRKRVKFKKYKKLYKEEVI